MKYLKILYLRINIMTTRRVICEYIWLAGDHSLRSKTRVLNGYKLYAASDISSFPEWNFDGSSTNQASGLHSELRLKPAAVYTDPFRQNIINTTCLLVMCEVLDKDGNPISSNHRANANLLFSTEIGFTEQPWFGIEQEYFINSTETTEHIGIPQGRFYCGVGSGKAIHRKVAEDHFQRCIAAGLTVSGMNAEVAPGQWEYQIGPCVGIDAGDQLWVSRWILERVSEDYNVSIEWAPKPYLLLNGSGCHTNYSTKSMRQKGTGLDVIYDAIEKLLLKHKEHMSVYGDKNSERMSGHYETASYDVFSFDPTKPVNRGASVRVGYDTIRDRGGYFEDRRPGSNMDPYLVTAKIFETTCL